MICPSHHVGSPKKRKPLAAACSFQSQVSGEKSGAEEDLNREAGFVRA
jgi:hypothetical protein